jgi:serine/threonine-protein kinase
VRHAQDDEDATRVGDIDATRLAPITQP